MVLLIQNKAIFLLRSPHAYVSGQAHMQNYCVRSALTPDVSKNVTGGCSEAGSTDGGPKLGREGREGEVPGAGSAMGYLLAVAGGSPEPGIGKGALLADPEDTGSPCNPQDLNQDPTFCTANTSTMGSTCFL